MTDEQRQELAMLQCDRKMAMLGMAFKTGLGLGVYLAWMHSALAGFIATCILCGFWDGSTGNNVSNSTDAQQRYYELAYLQRLESGDIADGE